MRSSILIKGKWVGLDNNIEQPEGMALSMPIKGLSPEEAKLHRRPLTGKGGNYLSAALLCIWDNIHGPKILSVWSKEDQDQKPNPTATG